MMPEEPMMEPEGAPSDWVSVAALVVRVIDEIDHRDTHDHDALLSDLLCAAWPTRRAQNQ
jgi:hypothetical protein